MTGVTTAGSLDPMGLRVDSRIDRVVVFPGAAWVTRIARVSVGERTELVVGGLPAALDDDTVQVAARGPARAADVRVSVEVVTAADPAAEDDREVHARRRDLTVAEADLAHLRGALAALGALAAASRGERDLPAPAWGDAVTARLAVAETRASREAALRVAIAAAERTVEDARSAFAAAAYRRAQATSAQLPPGAVRKALAITVEPDGGGGEVVLEVHYLVAGARWAPGYVIRLGDTGARLEMRAAIAQATGEDWRGVALEVSTAAPQRWVELPELPSLRIGRAQPAPARAGWRPPPPGVDELFLDWDRELGRHRPPPPPPKLMQAPEPAPTVEVAADAYAAPASGPPAFYPQTLAAKGGGGLLGALGGALERALPAPRARSAAPAAAPARDLSDLKKRMAFKTDERAAAVEQASPDDGELTASRDLLAYGRLRMAGPADAGRGKLAPVERAAAWGADPRAAMAVDDATRGARAIAHAPPPDGFSAADTGVYDYAFAADARLDVPSDGTWHNVALLARPAAVTVRHVVVPAVQPEVFRVAWFDNPLDAPLLAGPVDVFERGEVIVTSRLDETPPGGAVELGLGVDAAVKVARNARFREEAAGVLRGSLKLVHEVTITVENLGARAVALEVRERLPQPAPDEEDVEVAIDRVAPAWEPWKPEGERGAPPLRGGHRWKVELAPAARRDLQLDYHVKIAQKHELVGGNRREP